MNAKVSVEATHRWATLDEFQEADRLVGDLFEGIGSAPAAALRTGELLRRLPEVSERVRDDLFPLLVSRVAPDWLPVVATELQGHPSELGRFLRALHTAYAGSYVETAVTAALHTAAESAEVQHARGATESFIAERLIPADRRDNAALQSLYSSSAAAAIEMSHLWMAQTYDRQGAEAKPVRSPNELRNYVLRAWGVKPSATIDPQFPFGTLQQQREQNLHLQLPDAVREQVDVVLAEIERVRLSYDLDYPLAVQVVPVTVGAQAPHRTVVQTASFAIGLPNDDQGRVRYAMVDDTGTRYVSSTSDGDDPWQSMVARYKEGNNLPREWTMVLPTHLFPRRDASGHWATTAHAAHVPGLYERTMQRTHVNDFLAVAAFAGTLALAIRFAPHLTIEAAGAVVEEVGAQTELNAAAAQPSWPIAQMLGKAGLRFVQMADLYQVGLVARQGYSTYEQHGMAGLTDPDLSVGVFKSAGVVALGPMARLAGAPIQMLNLSANAPVVAQQGYNAVFGKEEGHVPPSARQLSVASEPEFSYDVVGRRLADLGKFPAMPEFRLSR